jgi:hypothetical protein
MRPSNMECTSIDRTTRWLVAMGNCGQPRLVGIDLYKGARLTTFTRLRDAAACRRALDQKHLTEPLICIKQARRSSLRLPSGCQGLLGAASPKNCVSGTSIVRRIPCSVMLSSASLQPFLLPQV